MHTNSEVILPHTLRILVEIMGDTDLKDFILVGGTALALQLGHRLSVDLDLFTQKDFDTNTLSDYLTETYAFSTDYVARNTLKGVIEDVKCDFITHKYDFIAPLIVEKNLRMASLLDIAAMKLNAIAHNGTRYKDFIDMYFLLEYQSLNSCLRAFGSKYPQTNAVVALKGITYFEDINFEFDKPVLIKPLSFNVVKKRLFAAVQCPEKVF